MFSEYGGRADILVAPRAGRTWAGTINFLELPATTLYDVVSQFFAAEDTETGAVDAGKKVHV